jgi:autotransporter-associated beta strand protein/T5SS/PEP-CTERM-associated repeat protein
MCHYQSRAIVRLLLLSLLLLPPGILRAATFSDPMMQGQDPEVAFKDGTFNLVQSDGCNIHLYQSATMGGLVTAANQIILSPGCSNVWAPEIHFFSNRWYLYYSLAADPAGANHLNYVAQSQGTNASGPYTILGALFTGFWNIDGSVFAATNGQLYFIFSGSPSGTQNIYIAPMSNPYTLSATPVMISQPTMAWETVGSPPSVNEGPYGFTHNGQTFIDYSASGCWTDSYCLGLLTLTGTNLMDPSEWTKSGPVLSQQTGDYGPGHNGIFMDASGQYWNIYHANDLSGQGCGGYRQLHIQRLAWNANNQPVYGSPVPIGSWISDSTNFLDAQFPLTEASGTITSNLIVALPGSLVGSPVWMQPGLHFNGSNSYVNCGAAIGNDVQNALTLSAWINPRSFNDWAGILCKGTNTEPYALQIWGDGSLRFTANFGAPSGGVGGGSWNSTAKLTTNQWQRVAVTYDGTTVRFYINGQLDSYQPTVALQFGVDNEPLTIGADLPGAAEYFQGTIFDARVYGRALSSAEVQTLPAFNPLGLVWSGMTNGIATGTWDMNATTNWLAAGILPEGYWDSATLTFNDTAAGATVVNVTTNVSPGSLTVSNNALNYAFTGKGSITNVAFLKQGSGTWTVANTNSFGGPSQIQQGSAVLAAPTTISGEGEFWVGNSATSGAMLVISNTTVNVTNNYFAIGRGGGAIGNVYAVTLTNANLNVAHWSCGWDGGLAGNNAYQKVALYGNSTVTDTGAGDTGFLFGESAGSQSTVLLANNSSILSPDTYFDVGDSGTATLTIQDNASLTDGGDFNAGDVGSSSGTVNLAGNALLTVNAIYVGSANAAGSTAKGTVNQTNGSVTTLSPNDGIFVIGGRSSASTLGVGTYNLYGGTLNIKNLGNAWIGGYGAGTLNVSGGSAIFSGYLSVGRIANDAGNLNISAGSVSQTNAARTVLIGEAGVGSLTVSGSGQLTAAGGLVLCNGDGSASTVGTVNLNGGNITAPTVVTTLTAGTSTFNFNGGTLLASGASSAFMTGLTTANVKAGGAVIDDGGFAITIGQALLNNGGGGLTKRGAGTLTLSGTSTYVGPTLVSNGKLLVTGSIGAGNVSVTNGATLGGTGNINGAVTVAAGSTLSPGVTVGTLNLNNNLTLAGNLYFKINKSLTQSNDYVSVSGNPANIGTGTLTVNNQGPALIQGDTFKLFSQAMTGGASLAITPPPGSGLTWANNLAVNGSIAVIPVSQVPTNINFSVVGNNLNLWWPADHTGWRLLVQTNNLNRGLSGNSNDWGTVAGSPLIDATNISINKSNFNEYYRLVYP